MKKNFLINGDFSKNINPFDRGLSFGDGVFRTFLVINGEPINWDLHYKKLKADAASLKIKIPLKKKLLLDIQKLFNTNKIFIGKIIITRGVSDQGYQFNKGIESTCIILKIKYKKIKQELYLKGVKLMVCKTKIMQSSLHPGVKHLNRIDNVMAKYELKNSVFDGVMLDNNNLINECVSSNIFVRYGKLVVTPKQHNGGVSGVCKEIIIKNIKSLGFHFKEQNIDLKQLKKADEVTITNSVFGSLFVKQIEEMKWKEDLFTSLIRNFIVNPKNK